jgi:hypothetical protein
MICFDNWKPQQAAARFEAALAIDPTHVNARRALQQIQSRRE